MLGQSDKSAIGMRTVLRDGHLSADGQLLAVTSDDHDVALLNIAARRLLGVLKVADLRAITLSVMEIAC